MILTTMIDTTKKITLRSDITWKAIYEDATEVHQEPFTPQEKHLGDLDLTKVLIFQLIHKSGYVVIEVHLNLKLFIVFPEQYYSLDLRLDCPPTSQKAELIYFRRSRVDFTDDIQGEVIQAIGMRSVINGKEYKQIIFVNPDGRFSLGQE